MFYKYRFIYSIVHTLSNVTNITVKSSARDRQTTERNREHPCERIQGRTGRCSNIKERIKRNVVCISKSILQQLGKRPQGRELEEGTCGTRHTRERTNYSSALILSLPSFFSKLIITIWVVRSFGLYRTRRLIKILWT